MAKGGHCCVIRERQVPAYERQQVALTIMRERLLAELERRMQQQQRQQAAEKR